MINRHLLVGFLIGLLTLACTPRDVFQTTVKIMTTAAANDVVQANIPTPPLPTPSPTTPSEPNVRQTPLDTAWLATIPEITKLSDDLGIALWKPAGAMPGQFRICHFFEGTSWSVAPNSFMNCVNLVTPDSTFEEIIASMYEVGILYPGDISLEPLFDYDYDFALYTHQAENGPAVYDAFLVSEGILFRASLSIGTPIDYTPAQLFAEQGAMIETFLHQILKINLERSG